MQYISHGECGRQASNGFVVRQTDAARLLGSPECASRPMLDPVGGRMADQDTQAVAYGSLRSILRALDAEDDDAMPMPDDDEPDWHYPEITPGAAVVCRYERVPTGDAADVVLSRSAPGGEDDERSGLAAGKVRATIAFAAPAAGLLLAGALFLLPTPNGQWARAALAELGLEVVIKWPAHLASSGIHQSAEAAQAVVPTAGQSPARGIQAFAEQAQRALAAHSDAATPQELPAAGN